MRGDHAFLNDILDSVQLVKRFSSGKTLEQFRQDLMLQEAVIHRLGIIGEAARRLSGATRGLMPEIPWDDVIRMRNILVHVYFAIEIEQVWRTVRDDLDPMMVAVQRALEVLGSEGPEK